MIVSYLDYMVGDLLPGFLGFLDGLMITGNVSLLSFLVAVILSCIVIGSILLRV